MLSPLKRHWEDVKGNAKWDLFKMVVRSTPWGGVVIAWLTDWVRNAPWYILLPVLLACWVLFWLFAWLVAEAAWKKRAPSLKIGLEDGDLAFADEMGSVQVRLNIYNPHGKTLEIASVEVQAMDTNPAHVQVGGAAVFPVELFPLGEILKQLHPQETWHLVIFEEAKIVEHFGKHCLRIKMPGRFHIHLVTGANYRLRIRVLIKDFPAVDERYLLTLGEYDQNMTLARFSRIPRDEVMA